jgi:hypothetical protein
MGADTEIRFVERDILDAMSEVTDPGQRTILGLMLRVLSTQDKLVTETVDKIDKLVNDEERMRKIVLDSHLGDHRKHHDWIDRQIYDERFEKEASKKSYRAIAERVVAALIIFVVGFEASRLLPLLTSGN